MDTYKIEKHVSKYKIVSFDIFDTLLKRDVYKPTDVFELVQKEYGKKFHKDSNFKQLRILAEKLAREKSKYQEVTLDEIYSEIDDADKEIYKSLELEMEAAVLHVNPNLKPVYDTCVSQGKDIYIISDMYLPRTFLETILRREGYKDFKAVVLSADYRKTKRSGELYKSFLEKYGIKASEVIHIGDSRYADYIGAQIVGIHAIHIPRLSENTLYLQKPDDQDCNNSRSFFAFINTRVSGCINRDEQLGYEVLGPILYAYCQWIHDQFEKIDKENKRLWFAARDMYLFEQVYKMLYDGEQTLDYMYISRKSLRPLLTMATGDMAESGNVFQRGECTLADVLRRMGYADKDVDAGNVDLNMKVNPRKLSDFPEAIGVLSSSTILNKEKNMAIVGQKYLNEHGFLDTEIVLADVGWHGTTQYILQRILDARSVEAGKKIFGLYLGCLDSTDERIGKDNYLAFVFDEQHDSEFAKGILLFESLILAPHGSTIRYIDNEGRAEPVLGEPENVSDFLRTVQSGAMRFVREFKESVLSSYVTIDPELCTKAFCKLTTEPKREELNTIGMMDYDNFGLEKIASPKPLRNYILNPKLLYHDLKYSPWRIGFLYKLFKIRFPYAKMYSIIRKKQGKQT